MPMPADPLPQPGSAEPPLERIRIEPQEVARALLPGSARSASTSRRWSQLAVASLALAVLGIPLLGCLLGPVAMLCGALAIASTSGNERLRGFRLAVAGTLLGIADFVGWTVLIAVLLSRPSVSAPPEPLRSPAIQSAGIVDAPEPIRRALMANVRSACGGSTGAGIVVGQEDGRTLVLTNRHVVDCGEPLGVTARGGPEHAGQVLWQAPEGIDLSVIGVQPPIPAEPMNLVLGAEVRVGDAVFAVGNPLGFEATYTAGAVSAIRPLAAGGHDLRVYQVQASVNPGNSGGGLYRSDGTLVGINTWTAEKTVSEGIGFALGTRDAIALLQAVDAPWARTLAAASERNAP